MVLDPKGHYSRLGEKNQASRKNLFNFGGILHDAIGCYMIAT